MKTLAHELARGKDAAEIEFDSVVNHAQQCIDNIERCVGPNGVLHDSQRHLIAHCLRRPGTRTNLRVQRAEAGALDANHADPT